MAKRWTWLTRHRKQNTFTCKGQTVPNLVILVGFPNNSMWTMSFKTCLLRTGSRFFLLESSISDPLDLIKFISSQKTDNMFISLALKHSFCWRAWPWQHSKVRGHAVTIHLALNYTCFSWAAPISLWPILICPPNKNTV